MDNHVDTHIAHCLKSENYTCYVYYILYGYTGSYTRNINNTSISPKATV